MKATIITMHSVYNYGTQLQVLATQEKLKEYFDDVEFIDFRRKDTYGKGLIKLYAKGSIVRLVAFLPTFLKWKKIFRKFQKKYINLSKKKYLDVNEFNNYEEESDLYITGSDQVWNTEWNNGILSPYYLSFVKNKPKYSYASSFGLDKLNTNEIEETKKYLSDYSRISVREDTGLKILKKQLGINTGIRIIDPTLVMPKSFWEKYQTKKKIKNKYFLIYNLKNNKNIDIYAKKLEEKTGIKAYRFCTRYDQVTKFGKSIVMPKVMDFITLVQNAEFVLTDSFHATAFSINMHTHPYCIYPEKYSNRLSDFLKLVGCEEKCKVKNIDDLSIVNETIDYDKTDAILDKERKRVDKYLSDIKGDLS